MKDVTINSFVLDASVAVAWCFEDQSTAFTDRVLDMVSRAEQVLVPALWPLEVANALLAAERRRRITVAQLSAMLARIGGLPIHMDPPYIWRSFDQILATARERVLTVYDAAYLELAMRKGVPLATLDDQLRRAAAYVGVKLVG